MNSLVVWTATTTVSNLFSNMISSLDLVLGLRLYNNKKSNSEVNHEEIWMCIDNTMELTTCHTIRIVSTLRNSVSFRYHKEAVSTK